MNGNTGGLNLFPKYNQQRPMVNRNFAPSYRSPYSSSTSSSVMLPRQVSLKQGPTTPRSASSYTALPSFASKRIKFLETPTVVQTPTVTSRPLTQSSPVRFATPQATIPTSTAYIKSILSSGGWDGCKEVKGRRCGVGLINPLNNCFLNSVFQALVHLPEFARLILEGRSDPRLCSAESHRIRTGVSSPAVENTCFHCALRNHIVRAVTSQHAFNPSWIQRFMNKLFPHHRSGCQEDAHEMLTLLLGALEPLPPKRQMQQHALTPSSSNGNISLKALTPSPSNGNISLKALTPSSSNGNISVKALTPSPLNGNISLKTLTPSPSNGNISVKAFTPSPSNGSVGSIHNGSKVNGDFASPVARLQQQIPRLSNSGGDMWTPIEEVFGGRLKNEICCMRCKTGHTNFEKIREINLGLGLNHNHQMEGRAHLDMLVSEFFKEEVLQNFQCKKCPGRGTARRSTTIMKPPAVLIIQLKRFNPYGGKNRLHVVTKPMLDLRQFLSQNTAQGNRSAYYKFSGVIEHLGGTMNYGHYVCAMRGFKDNDWFKFDDSDITEIDERHAQFRMEPYILFYRRCMTGGATHQALLYR